MKNELSVLVFLLVVGLAIAWNYKVQQKMKYLENYAKRFQEACQLESGCIIKPEGWDVFSINSYYDPKSGVKIGYHASATQFELSWKVATSVTLVATGGKNKAIEVKKLMD